MKLKQEQKAPNFSVTDIYGESINLYEYYEGKIMLSFFRYAECALCNLRISEIKRYAEEFEKQRIKIIAVFQSEAKSLQNSISSRHDFDFTIISDPEMKLYKQYGVKASWLKSLRTMSIRGFKAMKAASSKGFKLGGKVDGKFHQIPADFIIDENKRIEIAHYGNSIIDHLPLKDILNSVS
jgi:peroxiredoxin Q/BCP